MFLGLSHHCSMLAILVIMLCRQSHKRRIQTCLGEIDRINVGCKVASRSKSQHHNTRKNTTNDNTSVRTKCQPKQQRRMPTRTLRERETREKVRRTITAAVQAAPGVPTAPSPPGRDVLLLCRHQPSRPRRAARTQPQPYLSSGSHLAG